MENREYFFHKRKYMTKQAGEVEDREEEQSQDY